MTRPFLCLAALVCGGQLLAGTIVLNFTKLPSNTENRTYNGFIGGIMNDSTPFANLICDDYVSTTYVRSGDLTFNQYDMGDFYLARFGAAENALENYRKAAILVRALTDRTILTYLIAADYVISTGDIQYALWDLFYPASGSTHHSAHILRSLQESPAPLTPEYQEIYASLRIYTPTSRYASNQEFLSASPIEPALLAAEASVPEPDTLMLIGAALALLAVGSGAVRQFVNRTPDPPLVCSEHPRTTRST
jgi:hypothetical protein